MTAKLVISEHDQLGGLSEDDHSQYLLLAGRAGGQVAIGGTLTTQTLTIQDNAVDANQATWGPGLSGGLLDTQTDSGDIAVRHLGIGVSRAPTNTHLAIGAEVFTGSAITIVGLGMFPDFRPTAALANNLVPIQGNAWFATTNWGAGSSIRCLDFFPAPQFLAGGNFGSASLDISGINTSGLLNIAGQTVTANNITGIAVSPLANIFGGTDDTTANIVRGLVVTSAAATTGTWGRLAGVEIQPQTSGTINQGLWLSGDGVGSDLCLGAGTAGAADALVYYNGTNLIIDPDNVGTGAVYIGATADDDLYLNDLQAGNEVRILSDTNGLILGAGQDVSLLYDGSDLLLTTDLVAASDFKVDCGTQKTIELVETVWEDLKIVPGEFDLAGVNDPTLENWQPGGSGTTFKVWKFQEDDEIFFSTQLPHTYKEGTDIKAHVHWTPGDRGNEESGNDVDWKLDYTWANIDNIFQPSDTVQMLDACDGTDDKHQVTASVTLPGTSVIGSELLTDGDAEAAGVGAWTVVNGATLSKQAGARTGGSGTLVLQILNVGVFGGASQVILTAGKTYRVVGWAKSDGTAIAKIQFSGVEKWAGTASGSWEQFDFRATTTGGTFALIKATAGNSVQFDDVTVKEVEDNEISSMLVGRFYRDSTDDTWVGVTAAQSPALLEFDMHFEVNTMGSRQEFVK
jgi:hypothetical protein